MEPRALLDTYAQALRDLARDDDLIGRAASANRWFTPPLIHYALTALQTWFTPEATHFLRPPVDQPHSIGIIMAGNLPLVGLHDLLMVRLAGHTARVKPSSRDRVLLQGLIDRLPAGEQAQIQLYEDLPAAHIDALLAMGSDNTARYLGHTYAGKPQLLRKHRYSVAVWTGKETPTEAAGLARDILLYHGMGCRNVSNLLVAQGADLESLVQALREFPEEWLAEEWKQQVIWEGAQREMQGKLWRQEGLVWEKSDALRTVPIGVLNVVEFSSAEEKNDLLDGIRNRLQCLVGIQQPSPPGTAQSPGLWDFADRANTYDWLYQLT